MADENPPEATILLLGDVGCGKKTFLSRLSLGSENHNTSQPIELLQSNNQPTNLTLTTRLFNRPYRLQFQSISSVDTSTYSTFDSQANGTAQLQPNVIVICYDISSRLSLIHVQRIWAKETKRLFTAEKELPVLLLGLKRDLRSETDPNGIIYPQEGHKVASECRCDRYMECSAVTGELVHEVFEDICRTAAMSTKGEGGGLTSGGCRIM